ncbi:MAG: transglycosylase domain-containing protein [Chlamydiales bacterium]
MKWVYCLVGFAAMILASQLSLSKPLLLQQLHFSQAVYDEERHLLRLTLTPDEKYRIYTPLDKISPLLIEATLLQEDQYFYQHRGVNPIALIKAFWQTYVLRTRPIGASTITMQVARMRDGIYSKTISGKLWQIIRAVQLELFYSKQEILEAYLNLASYGGNIEGVGAASTIYFAKAASQLNLLEALSLSVIPQNPSKRVLNPKHAKNLQRARHQLFQRWVKEHPVDHDKSALIDLPLQLMKNHVPFLAPHFVDWVLQSSKPSEIISSLNLKLQTTIEKTTRQYLEQEQVHGIHNAAVLLLDVRNMEVKALIGSANFF